METDVKHVEMICPRCKTVEATILDAEDPPETVLIESPCPACLDADGSLSAEPVFKDAAGVSLSPLPRGRRRSR